VQTEEHIAAVDEQGLALLEAARAAGLDAPVPNCPQWMVRELVAHTGKVHRWAATHVREGEAAIVGGKHPPMSTVPADGLLEWYAEGHAALVAALTEAPDDRPGWTFIPGLPLRAFWARRQAHETAIHRADADSARGVVPAYPPDLAADGIDELLAGLFARNGGALHADPPVSFAVTPTDSDTSWRMDIRADSRKTTSPAEGPTDCTLSGTAGDLYLLLWNRTPATDPTIDGDPTVLDLWRREARVG